MKKWMYNALIIIFGAVLLVSGLFVGKYFIDAGQQKNRYDDLSQLRGEETTPRPTPTQGTEATEETQAPATLVEITDPETGTSVSVLPEFVQLYTMNSDIVGWLTIPGTEIDYPVMQTPEDGDFYLTHNFDKEENAHGCLYVREVCDVFAPSDNITVYGHRMRDGSMFARLDKFMDRDFYEENQYIYFDTLTELHTYQVIAVFLTTASVGEGFSYQAFVNAASEEEFNEYVSTCKELALYDTGVDAQYGDKLITLSTCEYSQVNGRLVVVAKRIS